MFMPIAFKPGDTVYIKEAEFNAVVNKVVIERGCIVYQCQWWVEKEFRSADFFDTEIEAVEETEKAEVGVI